MDRSKRLQDEKLAAAQKRHAAEELKEMRAKPEITKKSRQMTQNYIPIYARVNDIMKEKEEKRVRAEKMKEEKLEETLTSGPSDIPASHYRKNNKMVPRSRPNSAQKQWTKKFQDNKRAELDKIREEQEKDALKAALQNDGERIPFQPKIDARSQKIAKLHPSGGQFSERLYKDSQKRRAQQEARERGSGNTQQLAINERSRNMKQVGDVCSRLYEQGMTKERERRYVQSEKWEQATRLHKPSCLLDEEPPLANDTEVPFGAGVYMMPLDSDSDSYPTASSNVVNFVPYDPQYNDVLVASLFPHQLSSNQ